MASLPSNVAEWPALTSTTAAGSGRPFTVLDNGPEGPQPDPHQSRYSVDHSWSYSLPHVVVSTVPLAVAHPLVAPLPALASGGPGPSSPDAATDFYILYDPYAALEDALGPTAELQSVSDNGLFARDWSCYYEPRPVLMSDAHCAGYLGDSHSYSGHSSDSLPSLPGVGTCCRPNSWFPGLPWNDPSCAPHTCGVAV